MVENEHVCACVCVQSENIMSLAAFMSAAIHHLPFFLALSPSEASFPILVKTVESYNIMVRKNTLNSI